MSPSCVTGICLVCVCTGVLDEEADELINVNIQDTERVEKNLDLKKKKPTYNPYEMEEDEYGMVSTPPPPSSPYTQRNKPAKAGRCCMCQVNYLHVLLILATSDYCKNA